MAPPIKVNPVGKEGRDGTVTNFLQIGLRTGLRPRLRFFYFFS